MSLPASESSTHVHSNTSSADRFTDYARRITSLLCGSADVNGGRTVADWERFLRSSENSLLSSTNSYQQRLAAARQKFLHSQQEALDETISEGNEEGVNTSDVCGAEHVLKDNKHARNRTLIPISYCEIESTTAYSSESAPVSVADSLLATVSASASSATRSSSMSVESSVVNSQLTSLGSCSSVHVNSSSDESHSLEREESANENVSRQLISSESHTRDSQASTEFSAVSANASDHKHHLNWFRNPWHAQTRSCSSSVSPIGATAQSQHSEEVSDVSQSNGQFNNEEDYTLLHMPRSLLERHIRFDVTPSGSENATESDDMSETEAPTEYQSTVEGRNESASASGGFPDYGRGSPDGLSTGHTVESSSQSVTSEDILIVNGPEDDFEMQGVSDSASPEGVLLHLEHHGESRPPSEVSLPSTVSLESHNQSWFSDSPEDETMDDRLAAIDERILGMLPAGYHQSDDNLFGQRQADREEFLNELRGQLTEQESEWMRAHHPVPQSLPEEPDLPSGSSPFLVTTANVISALECPVCFTYMRSPIWLCVNGHNICGRCQQRILTCPVCRGRLLFTRNLALEAISGDLSFKTQEANTTKSDKDATSEQGDAGEVVVETPPPDTNAVVCTNTNRFYSGEIEHMYAELATWLGIRPTIATASQETNTNMEAQNEQNEILDTSRPKRSTSN